MTNQTVAGAVESKKDDGTEIVRQYQGHFAEVLPSHMRAEQWVRIATGLLRRNPKLARIAKQNPASLFAALLDCARLGLEPGDTYHLVPFGNEIKGISDYTGIIELIYRAGATRSVKVEVVYQADLKPDPLDPTPEWPRGRPRFLWQPSQMDRPWHNPDWFGDRGEMIGAYAYAEMEDGATSQVILMNKSEIDKVKAVSKTAKSDDSPWNNWPDRMWKKTVIRQLAKFIPTSAEFRRDKLRDAVQIESERVETTDLRPIPEILDNEDVVEGEVVHEPSPAATPAQEIQPTVSREPGVTDAQLRKLHVQLNQIGVPEQDKHKDLSRILKVAVTSTRDLTRSQAVTVIDLLERVCKDAEPAHAYDQLLGELAEADRAGDQS
jgi:recombination protein RecT